MPKMLEGSLSKIIQDGVVGTLPGCSNLMADTPVMVRHSGKLDLINAVAEQGAFYVPFAAVILAVKSRVRTACGTASGTAKLSGVVGGAGKYGTQAHATTDTAGTEFLWDLAAVGVTTVVPAGEVLFFEGDGGATGTGDCDVTVILRPA